MREQTDPWLKFFPTDWLGDSGLRGCSSAAKGLWIDMMSLMHKGVPYGHLARAAGVPMDEGYLARQVGNSLPETKRLLRELEDEGVFSRTPERVIFSRRMVRDQSKRLLLKQNASAGGRASWSSNLLKQNAQANSEKLVEQSSGTLASGTLASGLEGEKNATVDDNEAQIPTVAEVIDFGAGPAGIPEDYCAHYHAVCDEKQRWITGGGRSLLWRKEIVRWWAEARAKWRKKTDAPGKADLESIEAELQWQKDPALIAILLKKRRELEAR